MYATRPNVFLIRALVKNLIRLVIFEGGGYSCQRNSNSNHLWHHWKEYSVRETHKYFGGLSPDFAVWQNGFFNAACSSNDVKVCKGQLNL